MKVRFILPVNPWLILTFAVIFSIMACLTVCVGQMRWEIQRLSTLVEDSDDDIGALNRRLLKQEYPYFVRPFKEFKRQKVLASEYYIKY